MSEYAIRPLDTTTWDAFVQLAERHNGVWGGCWCTWFHPAWAEKGESSAGNRDHKERLVHEGRAHAALVFDGEAAVGVAAVALHGALDLIAKAGGGVVEAYPQDTQGKRTSGSFLYNGTRSLFEKAGFSYDRPKGKNHCVMRRTV
jgi:hypothetical protein